jgi:hypothetical protein
MSESGDPGHEPSSFPSGCLVSLGILFGVFFLIVSICSRG